MDYVTREFIEVSLLYVFFVMCFLGAELYALPTFLVYTCRAWIIFVAWFTNNQYNLWKSEFASRVPRGEKSCLSNLRRPDLASNHPGDPQGACQRFSTMPKLDNMCSFQGEIPTPVSPMTPVAGFLARRCTARIAKGGGGIILSDQRAQSLNMDHIFLSLSDFLWLAWFIDPPAVAGFLFGGPCTQGILGLIKTHIFRRLGFSPPKTEALDAERALVDFILGSSMMVWFGKMEKLTDGTRVATLKIDNATHIKKDCTVVSGTLLVRVNLTQKRMISATFSGKQLGAHDALALFFNAFAGHTHPIIHSYANWGVDPNISDPFLRRMAIMTIKYNNIGMESYPGVLELLRKVGITRYTTHDVIRLTGHQNHNVPSHKHVFALMKYSKLGSFLVKVRNYFLTEFERHSEDFPGIDGEALFIGTVMHSIDHRMGSYIVDTDHFVCGDSEFEADHDLAAITHACFIDRPPLRFFECRMSHAPNALFKKVYKYAKGIDARLASYMECCIAM